MTSLSRSDGLRQRGFTLLELVVVMTIVGLLMAIAIPSYKYVMVDNRMAGEVNDLLAAMQYARAEAIKEGNDVVVCSSSSGTACSGTPNWQSGWIVFSDPDNNGTLEAGEAVLKYHNAFTGGDTFISADNITTAVQFSRDGFAVGLANAGVNMQLHNSSADTAYSRCLDVSIVGALTTVRYGGALAGAGTCQ